MSYLADHTYADWQTYLAGGRKKHVRPLYSNRGWIIQYANKFNKQSDIQITAKWVSNHPIITIHLDNTKTISAPPSITTSWGGTWNPLSSHNVKYTIWKFTKVDVVQRNWKHYLIEKDAKLTPTKLQGCRMCSQTGKINGWCNAKACYAGERDEQGNFSCPDHPEAIQINTYPRWHRLPCEHGLLDGHETKRTEQCYSCKGVGKRDYGNKKVSVLWDGSPIRVQNGNIYKQPLTDLERIVAAYAGPTS